MEFSIKSILTLYALDYDFTHEISEDIIKLYGELTNNYYKEIDKMMNISVR